MAKKPQTKSAAPADTAPSAPPATAPAAVTTLLPDGLETLMIETSHAAIAVAQANAAIAQGQPGDEELKAVYAAAVATLQKVQDGITAWYEVHISTRLAAADHEADRQLEERRNALAAKLDELDKDAERLIQEKADALNVKLAGLEATTEGEGEPEPQGDDVFTSLERLSKTITVIGPARGLRRAGFHFDATPKVIKVTDEQRALITADPLLSVTDGVTISGSNAYHDLTRRPALTDFAFDDDEKTEVKVIGTATGRRRAGFEFGAEARQVRVTREQLEELLGDAELAVNAAEDD